MDMEEYNEKIKVLAQKISQERKKLGGAAKEDLARIQNSEYLKLNMQVCSACTVFADPRLMASSCTLLRSVYASGCVSASLSSNVLSAHTVKLQARTLH